MYVCNCNGIREGDVRSAIAAGASRPSEIFDACQVAAQCWRCVSDMQKMLDAPEQAFGADFSRRGAWRAGAAGVMNTSAYQHGGFHVQGDKAIIQILNQTLTIELTAVNQYFLHARMYDNWGYHRLGKVIYDESIGEMKHADKLIKRILFLEGLPNLQDLLKLRIGENVPEGLAADLELELGGRVTLVDGIKQCEGAGDFVSRHILREILDDTEEHIDFLETQLDLLRNLGEQNYLQSAMGELDDD